MENFINKLLSLDFKSISYLDRLKLCKEFLRLCEIKIPEKTGYDSPKLHLIMNEFNKNVNSSSINDRINLDRNSFTGNSGYHLVTTMWDIAHECCHGAQQNNVSFNTGNRNISNMFIMPSDHFFDIYAKIERDYDNQLNLLRIVDRFTAKIGVDKKLNDIDNFLKSFYWLHPIERESDNFAISIIEDVIDCAENMDLSEEQKDRLTTISESLLSRKENLHKAENVDILNVNL